jgi:cell division protein ZapA
MPEVTISIGGRKFEIACQAGEEQFLHSAATIYDREAQPLITQLGRVPADRMLLMAGLMLADKAATLEDELRVLKEKAATPTRVEVSVVPGELVETLAEIAARAESLADTFD